MTPPEYEQTRRQALRGGALCEPAPHLRVKAAPHVTPLVLTRWPALNRPRGCRVRTTWAALAARAAAPRGYASKDDLPRWSAATFRGDYRSLANVERVAAVVLDLDDGTSREQVVAAFSGLVGFAHTTWRSTPTCPRWRVVLPLARLVDRGEYDRCWRAVADRVERAGEKPDYNGAPACHAWAVPARHEALVYDYFALNGVPFDVDAALGEFPAPEPLPEPVRRPLRDDLARRVERGSRYLASMPPAISGAGGHTATFKAAVALVRGFELPEDEALSLLVQEFNPRCQPPWSAFELRHKVRSAATRGRLAPGWLATAQGGRP